MADQATPSVFTKTSAASARALVTVTAGAGATEDEVVGLARDAWAAAQGKERRHD